MYFFQLWEDNSQYNINDNNNNNNNMRFMNK